MKNYVSNFCRDYMALMKTQNAFMKEYWIMYVVYVLLIFVIEMIIINPYSVRVMFDDFKEKCEEKYINIKDRFAH